VARSTEPLSQRDLLSKLREWLAFMSDPTKGVTEPVEYRRVEMAIETAFEQCSKAAVMSPYILNHLGKNARAYLKARYSEWEDRREGVTA
jgi:hypothetical protein